MTDLLDRLTAVLADRYTLERQLGQGGMATVYVAQDVKHERKVAIKVLRPELAAVLGAERFVQEIKTTANLQHPNILPLFDSGEAGGFLYYVMPYIEGETLRGKLNRETQLSIDEAVKITTEVADALDYAHHQQVIHRDIKPENILLHDGSALVADFGIALAASKAGSRMTETGMSLGTPQYMSPEQATGEREITARSDVYALGCVLYEMLVGEPPFTGPTAQAIVARVMTGDPAPPRAERRSIPPNVEAAVLQALEKLPADRFTSAADFAAALGNPSFVSSGAVSGAATWQRPGATARLPWALLVAAVGFIAFDRLRPRPAPSPPAVQLLSVRLPENAAWVEEEGSGLAVSPDGTVLAYTGRDSSTQRQLFLRPLDQLDPIPVSGGRYGALPFFSPDGQSVGFMSSRGIYRAPVAGGAPEFVCDVPGYVDMTWLESDVIVFADLAGIGLRQCSMKGEVTTLLASDSGETFLTPHGLPGDRGVLFSVRRGRVEQLAVLDLRTRSGKSLEIRGTNPVYLTTGHLVYLGPDGVAQVVNFDANSLEARGEPLSVAEGIPRSQTGRAMMALSRGGLLVTAGRATTDRVLEMVDRGGRAERLYPRSGNFLDPRFSPDGRRIAVSLEGEIWLLDAAQNALTRLSFDSLAGRPVWTPDGTRVAYVRQIGAQVDLRLVPADGSAPAESLLAWPHRSLWETLFTSDERSMVVRTVGGPGSRDLWLSPRDAARKPAPLLESPADEVAPALSPDGRWLAYASNESGRYEVYVRPFPGMGARYPVSLDGGTEPMWSPRGGELFYRSGPVMLAAQVRAGTTFEVLRRTPLFSNADYLADPTHAGYDVAPDGAHFAMVRNVGGASLLTVTLNLFQNLGATGGRTPTGHER